MAPQNGTIENSSTAAVKALLEAFPSRKVVPVRWGDMDAMGHVNNTVYFQYFEEIRVPMMDSLELFPSGGTATDGLGPILASTDCRFKLPVTYPDTLHLGGRIERMTDDRLFFLFHAISEKHERVAAVGHSEIVCYDYQKGCKAALTEAMKAKVRRLNPGLVEADR